MRVLRYFNELRVMLLQIMNSLKPMVWAFFFLTLVILMFTLVFMQGVVDYFEGVKTGKFVQDPVAVAESKELEEMCGSFALSLLALFMSISGGVSWWVIVKPLMQVSPIYVSLFLLYIVTLMVGVLNIIAGIFVETATDAAIKDREAVANEEMNKNEALMKGLEELFDEFDEDKTGTISWQRFEELTKRNEVRAFLASLELDVWHAQEVFKLIDANDNGFISIDEFVVGIMRLKGQAKRTDVHSLMFEISRVLKKLEKQKVWVADRLDRIEEHLALTSRKPSITYDWALSI
eukprot:CAMPEP_0171079590 /NCGR_PEP_ID=MMETSP0766_2-20121228/15349_1 /TAXON_ID=439317 /ORGANISM="Gambierdiscus australes, Strain CAWD 149" /LENGTH=290 /DNA_ID=CAMNT_0011536789 /DNA_START=69 /DNA_END=941 /DNA_ORIENTATION=+